MPRQEGHVEAVNDAIRKASKGKLQGVLGVNDAELVSIDFNHSSFSSIFDATQTQVVEGGWCASCPGMTTNGASPIGCQTRRSHSQPKSNERGRA